MSMTKSQFQVHKFQQIPIRRHKTSLEAVDGISRPAPDDVFLGFISPLRVLMLVEGKVISNQIYQKRVWRRNLKALLTSL